MKNIVFILLCSVLSVKAPPITITDGQGHTFTVIPITELANNPNPASTDALVWEQQGTEQKYNITFAQMGTKVPVINTITLNTTNVALPNGYSFLVANTNVVITSTSGNGTLFISNSVAGAITVYTIIGHAGVNSSAALLLPPGKEGVVAFWSNGAGSTNFCTTTFQ